MATLEQIDVGTKEQYQSIPAIPANKKLTYTEVNDIVTKTNAAITQINANTLAVAANEEQIAINSMTAVLAL